MCRCCDISHFFHFFSIIVYLLVLISLVDQWTSARHISGERQTNTQNANEPKYQTMNMNRCYMRNQDGFFFVFLFFFAARFWISDLSIVNISATLPLDGGIRWLAIVAVVVIEYQNVFYLFAFFIVSISLSRYDSHRISFVFAIFRFEFLPIGQRMTRNLANTVPFTWEDRW